MPTESQPRAARILGILLILAGIVLNKWVLGALLVPDGQIEGMRNNLIIVVGETVLILTGLFLLWKRPRLRLPSKGEWALLIGSTLVCFFILEFSARIWLHNIAAVDQYRQYALVQDPQKAGYRFSPHHYLNYYTTPNYRRGKMTHNKHGYRNPDFTIEKPDGAFRIVCIGGSTTYTDKVEDDAQTYPALMQKYLREEFNYPNVEVINAGVPGYTSWESLINLQFRVLDLQPDLVIVYHGVNDVHPRFVPPEVYQGDNSGYRKQWRIPPVVFWERSALIRIISRRLGFTHQVGILDFVEAPTSRQHDYYPKPEDLDEDLPDPYEVLEDNPPVFFERNLKNMIAICRANDCRIMLATWAHTAERGYYFANPHHEHAFKEHNRLIKELGEAENVPVFDFEAVMPTDKKFWYDGSHVNESGSPLKARLFAEFIHRQSLIPAAE